MTTLKIYTPTMSAQYPRQVLFMPLHCSRLGIDRQASVILSFAWNCNEAGDWSANKRDAHVLEATLIEVIWLGIMLNCMNRWARRSRDSFDQSVIRIQFQEKRKYNKRINREIDSFQESALNYTLTCLHAFTDPNWMRWYCFWTPSIQG